MLSNGPAASFQGTDVPCRAQSLTGTRIALSLGRNDGQVVDRSQCLAVVLQEDVARLDAEEVSGAVGHDGQDGDAVVGRGGRRATRGRLGEGGIAQGQQPGRT